MAKLMENMYVEDKNAILGNDSTSANSTDSMETNEELINSPKHKEWEREGGQLMLMTGISYCVRSIVMTTH